jgi:hypothetical protein
MLPLVTRVQEACGRIGNITGKELARNIKDMYSLRTLRVLVVFLAAANVWLTVSLLAYLVTALLVAEPWDEIFKATFIPHIEFSAAFFYLITAVIGTTITPYMFFWQTPQEVEENAGPKTRRSLRDLRTDNVSACSSLRPWPVSSSSRPRCCTPRTSRPSTRRLTRRGCWSRWSRPSPLRGDRPGPVRHRHRLLGMLAIPVMAGPPRTRWQRPGASRWPVPELHRRQSHPCPGVRGGIQRCHRRPADLVPQPHRFRPLRHGPRPQRLAVPHHPDHHLCRYGRLGGIDGHLLHQGLSEAAPRRADHGDQTDASSISAAQPLHCGHCQ